MWRRRRRYGRRGRFPKPIMLSEMPTTNRFTPNSPGPHEPLSLELAELEAFRLVDLEGLSQQAAGEKMGVSRGTIWRLVQRARKQTAQALSEGRPIVIGAIPPENNRQTNQEKETYGNINTEN